jgi:hypothetical protein
LAGFGWIWLDLAGFGALGNPCFGAVLALAAGGGKPGIAAKRRKNTRPFEFSALFRGYFMVCYLLWFGGRP